MEKMVTFALVITSLFVASNSVFTEILPLQRSFLLNPANVTELIRHDRLRLGRILQSTPGVIDYQLNGTFPKGIYTTKIHLGSPPKEFTVVVDRGSDILWISCFKGECCPVHQDSPYSFDPRSSATARPITCDHNKCFGGDRSALARCSSNDHICHYEQTYADNSSVSGFYVADIMHSSMLHNDPVISDVTAPVAFGCSDHGDNFMQSARSIDGILGLGPNGISVVSQLATQGVAPWVFSHCLRGDAEGGGALVLGAVELPDIVYTPLVPHQYHYNVELQTISLNGQTVPIDPSTFKTSKDRGTVIDSGAVLAYLVEGAYDAFVAAMTSAVSQVALPYSLEDLQCYFISSSIDVFPQVTLEFMGGASLLLEPKDYLLRHTITPEGPDTWCLGLMKTTIPGISMLGDLVLRDKIVVYDLAAGRIGRINYNCSSPVNVSTVYGLGPRPSISIRTAPFLFVLCLIIIMSSLCV